MHVHHVRDCLSFFKVSKSSLSIAEGARQGRSWSSSGARKHICVIFPFWKGEGFVAMSHPVDIFPAPTKHHTTHASIRHHHIPTTNHMARHHLRHTIPTHHQVYTPTHHQNTIHTTIQSFTSTTQHNTRKHTQTTTHQCTTPTRMYTSQTRTRTRQYTSQYMGTHLHTTPSTRTTTHIATHIYTTHATRRHNTRTHQ